MTVSAWLHVKRNETIVKKLKELGTVEKGFSDIEEIISISEESFNVHNKKFKGKEPHLWYKYSEGDYGHYPNGKRHPEITPPPEIVSHGHGFQVWIEKDQLVFISNAHWNIEHAEETIEDLKQWIRENIHEPIEILEAHAG